MTARRAARLAVLAALWLLGGAAVLVGLGFGFLQTRWGNRLLREQAVELLNGGIRGHIDVRDLRYRFGTLVLGDVVIRSPDGQVAIAAARASTRLSLLPLLRHRIVLRDVVLDRPRVILVSGPDGLNLGRTFAARQPSEGGNGVRLEVHHLTLRAGLLEWHVPHAGPLLPLRLVNVDLDAQGFYDSQQSSYRAAVTLVGDGSAPLPGPVRLSASSNGYHGAIELDVALRWADNAVDGHLYRVPHKVLGVNLRDLTASPALLARFAPRIPFAGPIVARGELEWRRPVTSTRLELAAGGGSVRVIGTIDGKRHELRGFDLRASGVDLARVLRGAPRTDLSLTASAALSARDLAHAGGRLAVDAPASRVGGTTLGPVHVRVEAGSGELRVQRLQATVPGARIDAAGALGPTGGKVRGTLRARDLAALMRLLFPAGRPSVAGAGQVGFVLAGPLSRPALTADARFARLRAGGADLRGLHVGARIGDVLSAAPIDATVVADALTVGGRPLGVVSARIARTARGALAAGVALRGPTPLDLTAGGDWLPRTRNLRLDRLTLDLPDQRWALLHPAFISLERGLAIDDLALASGEQRLALSVRGSRRPSTQLVVRALALGRLPAWVVPPRLGLAGTLDAHLELQGRRSVLLDATVRDLALQRRAIGDVTAQLRGDRDVRAQVQLTRHGRALAAATLRLDAPLGRLGPRTPLALELHAHADSDRPLPFAPPTGPLAALRAKVELGARLSGSAADPRLDADLRLEDVKVRDTPVCDASAAVHYARGQAATTIAATDAAGGRLAADGVAAVELAWPALRRVAWHDVPIQANVTAEDLSLDRLVALTPGLRVLQGQVRVHGTLRGTLGAPRFRGQLSWPHGRVVAGAESSRPARGP